MNAIRQLTTTRHILSYGETVNFNGHLASPTLSASRYNTAMAIQASQGMIPFLHARQLECLVRSHKSSLSSRFGDRPKSAAQIISRKDYNRLTCKASVDDRDEVLDSGKFSDLLINFWLCHWFFDEIMVGFVFVYVWTGLSDRCSCVSWRWVLVQWRSCSCSTRSFFTLKVTRY